MSDIDFKPYREGKRTPNLTLYIDKKNQDKLKRVAKEDNRSMSKQVIHMMEYYIKHKDLFP